MNRSARIVFLSILSLALVALITNVGFAGPGCAGASKDAAHSCAKTCAAVHAEKASVEVKTPAKEALNCHADGETCSQEECIARCVAMGMSKEEAEACYEKYHSATATKAAAHADCPAHKTDAAKTSMADCTKTCTKETCITKLVKAGLTQKEVEAQYAACHADGNCSGKTKGVCCAEALLKKTGAE